MALNAANRAATRLRSDDGQLAKPTAFIGFGHQERSNLGVGREDRARPPRRGGCVFEADVRPAPARCVEERLQLGHARQVQCADPSGSYLGVTVV